MRLSKHFSAIFKDYYLRVQRGKHLKEFELLPGLYLIPMDEMEYFSSEKIHCGQCLRKEHKAGRTTYSHQALQTGIMHPQQSVVIPLMPEDILMKRAHYIFVAKPADHPYLMEWLAVYPKLDGVKFTDKEGRVHAYEWMNGVPLNGREDSIEVNFSNAQ